MRCLFGLTCIGAMAVLGARAAACPPPCHAPHVVMQAKQAPPKKGDQDKTQDTKQEKRQDKKQGKPQEKKGQKKPGTAVDPTQAAAEALRKLLQRKKRGEKGLVEPTPHKVWKIDRKPPPPGPPPGVKDPAKKKSDQDKKQQTTPPTKDVPPKGRKPEGPPPVKTEGQAGRLAPGVPRAGKDDPADVIRRMRERNDKSQAPVAKPGRTVVPPGPRPGLTRQATPESLLRGRIDVTHRGRRSPDRVKQETLSILALDYGDARRHPVTAHLLGRAAYDSSSRAGDDSLDGLDQTFRSRFNGRLYAAHVDLHEVRGFERVRLGRHTLLATSETLMVDGVSAESRALGARRWQFGGHVGVPSRIFESSPRGDFAAGAFGAVRPWRGGRVRFDYQHLDDERLNLDHDNDLFALTAAHSSVDGHTFWGRYTHLDNRPRDVRVRGATHVPEYDLDIRASYDELLRTQGAMAVSFDPLSDALLDYHPYRQFGLEISQRLTPQWAWDLGVFTRDVVRRRDVGMFNRDFDRLAATVEWTPADGASVSVHADAYRSNGRDSTALGAEYRQQLGDGDVVSLGTLFSLYEYDFVSQVERDHVRNWFARWDHDLAEGWRFRFQYEFETGPFPDNHRAEVRLTWVF